MKKLVFRAEAKHVEHIKALVRSRQFPSVSAFLREAVDEKLRRARRERLSAEVARYCDEGYADEDRDLVALQAFGRRSWPGRTTGRAGDPCQRISRRPERTRTRAPVIEAP